MYIIFEMDHVFSSSLSAKLEHLTDLQRHLEESLRSSPAQSPQRGSGGGETAGHTSTTSYNTYYFGRGEHDNGAGDGEEGHTSKWSPHGRGTKRDLNSALQDALAQVGWGYGSGCVRGVPPAMVT